MLEKYRLEYEDFLESQKEKTSQNIDKILKARVHIFDFDVNLLFLNTKLFIEEYIDWEWQEIEMPFVEYREKMILNKDKSSKYRKTDRMYNQSRDFDETNYFMKDLKETLDNYKNAVNLWNSLEWIIWASFYDFKKAVISWEIISIITARWHNESNFRNGIKLLIQEIFSEDEKKIIFENIKNKFFKENLKYSKKNFKKIIEKYLSYSKIILVNNSRFFYKFNHKPDWNTHIRKQIAFIEAITSALIHHKEYDKISVGFSDDEPKNLEAIHEIINKIKTFSVYDKITFSTIDTSSKTHKKNFKH